MTKKRLFSISVLLCSSSLASAGTITSISGACIMDNGAYVQTWSYELAGPQASPAYTCNDPDVADSTVTFAGYAGSTISPQGAFISEEVYSNGGALSCESEVCHDWTTITETVSIQEDETFIATGGVGQGFIVGECSLGSFGGAEGSGDTSFGGSNCPAAPTPFTPVAFTFGQAFTLHAESSATTSGHGSPNDTEWELDAFTTEIDDAYGNPIQGVIFTQTPEPSCLLLLAGGLLGLGVWRRRSSR